MKKNTYQQKNGFAALIVITVTSAILLAAAMTAGFLGIQEVDNVLTGQRTAQVQVLAKSCLEDSLLRLRLDPSYAGSTLNLNQGTCVVSISTSGNEKNINLTVTLNTQPILKKNYQAVARQKGKSLSLISFDFDYPL